MFLQIKSFDSTQEAQGIFEAYANVKYFKDKVNDVSIDGAFMKSVAKCKETGKYPKMLLQHDYKQVVGVWLDMYEDEKGLRVKGQLAMNTTLGRETYELMKMGALDSLSIGYVVQKETYDAATKTNYLEELDLREISIVTFACNEESLIDSVKSEDVQIEHVQQEAESNETEQPTTEIESKEIENPEALNIPEDNENEIDAEVMAKLDELVIGIKLNQILKELRIQ